MKIKLLIAFSLFFIVPAMAQDYIFLLKGDTLKAHVINVSKTNLLYTQNGQVDTTILDRTTVERIVYQNGTILNLNKQQIYVPQSGNTDNDSLYNLGQFHAKKYYNRYKPAVTGTIITSILSPPYGLIPAIACANHRPEERNLSFPDNQLSQNPIYYSGYSDSAFKIKKQKVWRGFALGSGISIAAFILLPLVLINL